MNLVHDRHAWNTSFVLLTIIFCLVFRFISVYFLTYCANYFTTCRKVTPEEMFIMGYGGLRGAVCFSLAAMLDKRKFEQKELINTTTIAVILFTVFIQGITIKPLVRLLRIRLQKVNKELSMAEELNDTVVDHVMAGVEEVIGQHGNYFLREFVAYYDHKYLKVWLQRERETKDAHIMAIYDKIALEQHYAHLGGSKAAQKYGEQQEKELAMGSQIICEDVLYPYTLSAENVNSVPASPVQNRAMQKRASYHRVKPRALSLAIPMHPLPYDLELESNRPTSPPLSPTVKSGKELRRLFNRNPVQQFHQKVPRQFKDDNSQDLSHHMQQRHLRARRLSTMQSIQLGTPASSAATTPETKRNRCYSDSENADARKAMTRAHYKLGRVGKAMTMDETKFFPTRRISSPKTGNARPDDVSSSQSPLMGKGSPVLEHVSEESDTDSDDMSTRKDIPQKKTDADVKNPSKKRRLRLTKSKTIQPEPPEEGIGVDTPKSKTDAADSPKSKTDAADSPKSKTDAADSPTHQEVHVDACKPESPMQSPTLPRVMTTISEMTEDDEGDGGLPQQSTIVPVDSEQLLSETHETSV